jgi:hypothetical protein
MVRNDGVLRYHCRSRNICGARVVDHGKTVRTLHGGWWRSRTEARTETPPPSPSSEMRNPKIPSQDAGREETSSKPQVGPLSSVPQIHKRYSSPRSCLASQARISVS